MIGQRSVWAVFGLVALVLAVGTACDPASVDSGGPPPPTSTVREQQSPSPTEPPSPTATPGPVVIAAVGDMMLARSIGARVLAGGPAVVFDESIAELLRGADITVGNLETSVSARGEPQFKGYTFRAPPETVEALALAGFDAVSLANNHALDYGPEALLDTASTLRGHGVQPVGGGEDASAARAPAVFERNGLRIAFVGLLDAPAEGSFSRASWEALPDRPGVAWADRETVTSVVSAAARSADVVVAMLHFGIEYAATPSAGQRELARAAVDAGASLVIGSHPHVLQEVEDYEGGVIAYSMGNFVFDGFDGASNESAILLVTITAAGIASWELVPVDIVENGLPRLRESP